MQTFLPYEDFTLCAVALDWRRLNKQITECIQILNAIESQEWDKRSGWFNHPATQMWVPTPTALAAYGLVMAREWRQRGYKSHIESVRKLKVFVKHGPPLAKPEWLGEPELHLSHQANLVRKDPVFYGPKFPNVEPMDGYWWPTHHGY